MKLVFRTAGVQDIISTDIDEADLRLAARSGQLRGLGIEVEKSDPPDPYADGLAKLKAAEATPLSTFENTYADAGLRALAATRAALDESGAAAPWPRLTAAELAEFTPADPYAAGIKALQLKERR